MFHCTCNLIVILKFSQLQKINHFNKKYPNSHLFTTPTFLLLTFTSCVAQKVHEIRGVAEGVEEKHMLNVWISSNGQQLRQVNGTYAHGEHLARHKNRHALYIYQ